MNLESYIGKLEQLNPNLNLNRIVKAYQFGESAHTGQFRKSGENYFIHPVQVSIILAELEMDEDTIIAGLLHDVIEDTIYTYEEVERVFGTQVAEMVDGVTKLGKIHYESKEERQAESLRKMFIAMAKDIRVIFIKLADRLHNMRTLKFMPDEKKKEKALETLEIFAPVAHRLGIHRIKWELEDLSLFYMDPEGYYDLVSKVDKKRDERETEIAEVIAEMRTNLDESGVKAEITGRPKHFYSIYKKMHHQNKEFNEIFDLTAIRVLVDSVKDCYGVLGIVHTLWKPIPGRFKDFIAMPKPNMYQSLHTTVIGPGGEPFEIQIRTWEMHKIAEFGIAAHWKYKEGVEGTNEIEDKLSWLRQMMEWEKDMSNSQEFVESLKIDVFENQVFVFTPKGEVVELPDGSTPVDFAYKIHSGVGNSCVGAKVDGRIVPLNYKLTNGKIVDIITAKNSQGPSRDWLKFVKSTQARNKIKHWFKKERREENIEKGREMLEREIRRSGQNFKELMKAEWMGPLMKRLSVKDADDLFAAIGYGGIMMSQVMPKIREKLKEEEREKELQKKIKAEQEAIAHGHTHTQSVKTEPVKPRTKPVNDQGVTVRGADNMLIRFAKCCNPVPGDQIIGYITRGRGVTIHRADCPNFQNSEGTENRFIEVDWIKDANVSYLTEIQIIAPDRKGLLTQITALMADMNVLVVGVNAKRTRDEIAIVNLSMEIADADQLKRLMSKFRSMPEVIEVKRVTS